MTKFNFARLALFTGIGVAMWVYLPMMELLELLFRLFLALFFVALIFDGVAVLLQIIPDFGSGAYAKGSVWLENGRQAIEKAKQDVRDEIARRQSSDSDSEEPPTVV